jgi:hypothetical protein
MEGRRRRVRDGPIGFASAARKHGPLASVSHDPTKCAAAIKINQGAGQSIDLWRSAARRASSHERRATSAGAPRHANEFR